jgi:hypothetical protein
MLVTGATDVRPDRDDALVERRQAKTRNIAVLFLLLYAYWPADISHRPFASLTLSDVFGTVAAGGVGVVLTRALFEPSDDGIKDAWGWLGVLIAGLAVVARFYFSPRA